MSKVYSNGRLVVCAQDRHGDTCIQLDNGEYVIQEWLQPNDVRMLIAALQKSLGGVGPRQRSEDEL